MPRRGGGCRAGGGARWERKCRKRLLPGQDADHRRGAKAGGGARWERKCRKRLLHGRDAGRRPQTRTRLQGRWRRQVGAEMPEKAPTWTGRGPQTRTTDAAAGQTAAPGGSGIDGKGSHLDGTRDADHRRGCRAGGSPFRAHKADRYLSGDRTGIFSGQKEAGNTKLTTTATENRQPHMQKKSFQKNLKYVCAFKILPYICNPETRVRVNIPL